MKKLFYLPAFFLLAATFFMNCSNDDDGLEGNPDENGEHTKKEITFIEFAPTEGTGGTEVVIYGTNFGEDMSVVKVWVNEVEGELVSVGPTRINFRVAEDSGTGIVKVKVGDIDYSFAGKFTYVEEAEAALFVSTLAGQGDEKSEDGIGSAAYIIWPYIFAYDRIEDAIFFTEFAGNEENSPVRIRRVTKEGAVTTIADVTGNARYPRSLVFSLDADTLFIGNEHNLSNANNIAGVGFVTRKGDFKDFQTYIPADKLPQNGITSIAIHPVDGSLFTYYRGRSVYRYNKVSQNFDLLIDAEQFGSVVNGSWAAEDGVQNVIEEGMDINGSILFSSDGKTLYWNGREPYQGLLKADYDLATKRISNLTKFAGNGCWGINDGQGTEARFDQPHQMAIDSKGNIFVSDSYGDIIRKITPSGLVSTYAGKGYEKNIINGTINEARFCQPFGIVFDSQDNLYVGDRCNHRIRVIGK